MAEDQTLEETLDEETSEETAGEEQTPKKTEPDYKALSEERLKKFVESQKEAIRLAKENKELKASKQPEKVESSEGETIDQIVKKTVQQELAPITKQQQEAQVETWLSKNPDAYDHLKEIEEGYQSMPGKTIGEKLENAFLVAKKDAMKTAGKKEMAFALHQREQASIGGGGASESSDESLPELTQEEKMVAQKLGIKPEAYAKNKSEK